MPSTINLRRKIKSVTSTKQITRAMQMVAASKMRRAQEAVLGTRAYAAASAELVGHVKTATESQAKQLAYPLLVQRPVKRIVLLVIASDKGLAGGYNANVLKRTLNFLQSHQDKEVQVVTVGRKIQEALSRIGQPLLASFTDFPGRPVSHDIVPIAKLTTEAFLADQCDQVSIIYTKFYSTLRQVAEEKILLPIQSAQLEIEPDRAEDQHQEADYLFEPAADEVLSYILPRFVETELLQTILDAIASEHSSRMLAMKNATDNASELIDDLQLTYNTIRQANITREIAEISAGAGSA